VGRFAGERTLVVVGDARQRLMMFRGTWGAIKKRLDDPQLEVTFEPNEGGCTAKLKREPEPKPTAVSRAGDFLSQAVTIAAVVVAYHFVRSLQVDYARTAMIAVGGAVAWSLIGYFFPGKPNPGLQDLVDEALAPLKAKPKKKPKAKADEDARPARDETTG
jgi:hypothetical protein